MRRTDLADEAHKMSEGEGRKIEGVIVENKRINDEIEISSIEVLNEAGETAIGKGIGKYITIDAEDLKFSNDTYEAVCKIAAEKIRELANFDGGLTLVVGLGNDNITPDRLGSDAISEVMVTHHMKEQSPEIFGSEISSVCAIAPGVLGTTGMETADIIRSIANDLKPSLIIAIDALAASEADRIGTTIQISNAGIQPGAGVGNNRSELSEKALGIPVIAIGVPTVIDAWAMTDTKGNTPYMVTPRDIDLIIKRCSKTIASSINLALQQSMTLDEIEEFVC